MVRRVRNFEVSRSQQIEAKRRRSAKDAADEKYKILYTMKRPLLKLIGENKMKKKFDELEMQKLGRTWCVNIHTRKVLQRL